jgi:hypothetical protein
MEIISFISTIVESVGNNVHNLRNIGREKMDRIRM